MLRIAEIGCGPGTGIHYLKNLEFGAEYYGIDISIDWMKKHVTVPDNWKFVFLKNDVNKLDCLKDDSFELILSFSALHHFKTDVIERVSKLLKNGGFFVLREPSLKNPFAAIGRKLIKDYNTENELPLLPNEIKKIANSNNLELIYERGFHFITGPLQYLLGMINMPKIISIPLFHVGSFIDGIIRSPAWSYDFIHVYVKRT